MHMPAGQVLEELGVVVAGKGMEEAATLAPRAEPAAQLGVERALYEKRLVRALLNLTRKTVSRPNLPRARVMSTDLADQTD